jgi:hypothetical protein
MMLFRARERERENYVPSNKVDLFVAWRLIRHRICNHDATIW